MYLQKQNIIIVCEGPSEKAYLQQLNRYFDEEEIPIHFIPKSSGGGQFCLVKKKYREVKKANPKSKIKIWVDFDRYRRNDNKDLEYYNNKSNNIPDFLFSYMNFEDFLTMHLSSDKFNNWVTLCVGRDHFNNPSHSRDYLDEFIQFIGGYSKGDIPIEINKNSLSYLRKHQEDEKKPIKCDLAKELFILLDNYYFKHY